MRVIVVLAIALSIAVPVRADDAAELRELRARIEKQAAELDALRAAMARLEAKLAPTPVPTKEIPLVAAASPIVFSGLLQGWYVADNGPLNDTFRIRRSELRFNGKVTKGVGWTIMIDPSKVLAISNGTVNQTTRVLQDAFFTLPLRGGVTLVAGQAKIPFALEGVAAPMTIDVVERALFAADRARGGTYGDVREIGIGAKGTLHHRFDYSFGLYNGLGETPNDVDRNDRKSIIGRFVARFANGLQVGASGARDGEVRDRIGAELLFTRGPLKLKGEIVAGHDDALDRRGGYAHVGYRINSRVEAVARVDQWDPDTSSDSNVANALERDYIAGFNFFPREGLRLQANAVRKTFRGDVAARNLILINLETSW